jgi:hypothetical protein
MPILLLPRFFLKIWKGGFSEKVVAIFWTLLPKMGALSPPLPKKIQD